MLFYNISVKNEHNIGIKYVLKETGALIVLVKHTSKINVLLYDHLSILVRSLFTTMPSFFPKLVKG